MYGIHYLTTVKNHLFNAFVWETRTCPLVHSTEGHGEGEGWVGRGSDVTQQPPVFITTRSHPRYLLPEQSVPRPPQGPRGRGLSDSMTSETFWEGGFCVPLPWPGEGAMAGVVRPRWGDSSRSWEEWRPPAGVSLQAQSPSRRPPVSHGSHLPTVVCEMWHPCLHPMPLSPDQSMGPEVGDGHVTATHVLWAALWGHCPAEGRVGAGAGATQSPLQVTQLWLPLPDLRPATLGPLPPLLRPVQGGWGLGV